MDTQTTSALALVGDGYTISITDQARALKANILRLSAAVAAVTCQDDQANAMTHLKALADFRNVLEKSRTDVKAPVLKIGRAIDDKAKEFALETDAEEKRIRMLLQGFANRQDQDRRAAEAVARKAAQDAENARLAAIDAERRAEREKERQRIADEEAARKASLPDTSFADAASALRKQREGEALRADQQRRANEQAEDLRRKQDAAKREADRLALAAVMAPAPRMALDFTVIDIRQLYAVAPHLVELSPKRRDILAALDAMRNINPGAVPVIAGLGVFEVAKISAR